MVGTGTHRDGPGGEYERVFTELMPSFAQFLAPLALMLPMPSADLPGTAPGRGDDVSLEQAWQAAGLPDGPPLAGTPLGEGPLADLATKGMARSLAGDDWNQVRIEQRLIIRIAPRGPGRDIFAPPPMPGPPRYYERKTSKCLPVAAIAGVQVDSNDRLLLFLRDRRLIGASLDKACKARDFYSGFYVERSVDGQLCSGRDTIHSRAGANCAITKMRELVPDDD